MMIISSEDSTSLPSTVDRTNVLQQSILVIIKAKFNGEPAGPLPSNRLAY